MSTNQTVIWSDYMDSNDEEGHWIKYGSVHSAITSPFNEKQFCWAISPQPNDRSFIYRLSDLSLLSEHILSFDLNYDIIPWQLSANTQCQIFYSFIDDDKAFDINWHLITAYDSSYNNQNLVSQSYALPLSNMSLQTAKIGVKFLINTDQNTDDNESACYIAHVSLTYVAETTTIIPMDNNAVYASNTAQVSSDLSLEAVLLIGFTVVALLFCLISSTVLIGCYCINLSKNQKNAKKEIIANSQLRRKRINKYPKKKLKNRTKTPANAAKLSLSRPKLNEISSSSTMITEQNQSNIDNIKPHNHKSDILVPDDSGDSDSGDNDGISETLPRKQSHKSFKKSNRNSTSIPATSQVKYQSMQLDNETHQSTMDGAESSGNEPENEQLNTTNMVAIVLNDAAVDTDEIAEEDKKEEKYNVGADNDRDTQIEIIRNIMVNVQEIKDTAAAQQSERNSRERYEDDEKQIVYETYHNEAEHEPEYKQESEAAPEQCARYDVARKGSYFDEESNDYSDGQIKEKKGHRRERYSTYGSGSHHPKGPKRRVSSRKRKRTRSKKRRSAKFSNDEAVAAAAEECNVSDGPTKQMNNANVAVGIKADYDIEDLGVENPYQKKKNSLNIEIDGDLNETQETTQCEQGE